MNSTAKLIWVLVCAAVLEVLSCSVHAGILPAAPTRIRIPRVTVPPKIEDYLDGKRREEEIQITEFRQREPNDGDIPKLHTTAYLSYDGSNLYAIFVCQQNKHAVRAHLSRREDIEEDDHVILNLDTFHDGRHAYEFFVNPRGVQRDGIITEGQDDDFSFDTVWQSQGKITANGYVVWMAIPFKSLRFRHEENATWGIALGRYAPASNEFSTWPYLTERVEAYVPQFATLEAIDGGEPGRNFQFIPYVFAAGQKFLDTSGSTPSYKRANEWRGGLDAKLVLHDGLTFDFTANPDFSQVETDEPQVTINQRYEVFFPEKRPFFTEGANYFQTPENLFFSRRVVDPQFGLRMTGKVGGWAFGALTMDDRAPGNLVPSNDPLAGDHAQIQVARAQREIGRESTVGIFLSRLHFGTSSNEVLSADGRWKLTPNWVLTGQLLRSSARDLDGRQSNGTGVLAEVSHTGRHFTYRTSYRDRSPDLTVDLGFIPRVDIRQIKNAAEYQWRPQTGPLVSIGPALNTLIDWDYTGRMRDWSVDVPFSLQFRRSTVISAGHTQVYEVFEGIPFHQQASYFEFASQPSRMFSVNSLLVQGTNINYFPAKNLIPFLANSTDASLGVTFRPSSRLRLEETYIFSRLGSELDRSTGTDGKATFNNHLLRTKLSYQFTRALSLRAIVDYNGVLANPTLIDVETTKQLTTDILLSYVLHPGTALYVGYNGGYENVGLDGMGTHRSNSPSLMTQRQFFVKLSYLLRF